jgi:hypothetical protein
MLGWLRYGFKKKHNGARYVELVFLHPVGSAGMESILCVRGMQC